MEQTRNYYEAYDDRYRQVHAESLRWFSDTPSAIVGETITEFGVPANGRFLEIGCGEGRDAKHLLSRGFDLMATDVSPEVIAYCRRENPGHLSRFFVLDCVKDPLEEKFDFIYAVAVIHMLVLNEDREAFYRFVREHLTESGIALICSMGDGTAERRSDITTAFDLQERHHLPSGRSLLLAGTSCRMVSFGTFAGEIASNGLSILKQGITSVEPDFPQMMYAVVKRRS